MLNFFNSLPYNILITIITIGLLIYSMYSKIKYYCLQEAITKVANIERLTDLSGEEKFAIVVTWINDELPKIFKNSLINNIIKTLVQAAYDNCFKYAKNYIKRKTGYDISELLDKLPNTSKESSKDMNSDKLINS